jgi:hypothetical protein
MTISYFNRGAALLLLLASCLVDATPRMRRSITDGLLINVQANTCQDVFDYFPDICNTTGFGSRKFDAETISCNTVLDSCGFQTFCSVYDCCQLSSQVMGTCGIFFDSVNGSQVCTDNGFNTVMANETVCMLHPQGCGLASCCGSGTGAAQSCQSLFALYENPYGQKSNTSYNGTFSCNVNEWYKPKSSYDSIISETDEFVRGDCCDIKQTCGLTYEKNNGTGSTICSKNGFSFSQRDDVQCNPVTNIACTLNSCCFVQNSCRAFNFVNEGAQSTVCKNNGYGFAQPVSSTPCSGGLCKFGECCVRQDTCKAYLADDNRRCQKQGYSYNKNVATKCDKGVCSAAKCCTTRCPSGGFNSTTKTCNNL